MGVFAHRQRFAAIELYGELGRELVEPGCAFQQVEDLPCQYSGVEQHGRIEPGQWAEHQIAYIITRRVTRAEPCGQQVLDQPSVVLANAANLQIGPVGRLDHPTGETLGSVGHGIGLVGQQQPTGQFDPADAAITRGDDAPQPRTGRGTGRNFGAGAASRGHPAIVKVRFSVEGAVLCLLCPTA